MADILDQMKAALSTTAAGYAAVIDGVLNIATVSDTENAAAFKAAVMQGIFLVGTCNDPTCDCIARGLERIRPNTRIVAVKVEVGNG